MNKLTIGLIILAIGIVLVVGKIVFFSPKSNLTAPRMVPKEAVKAVPSKTLKSYTDPSGFTFSYPDNLSLVNNESTNSAVYSDISLSSKDVDGGLNINISDSKFSTLDEWIKTFPTSDSKEVNLGNLKALEITAGDKIILGALDQGVLFKITSDKKDFWEQVYSKVLAEFAFVSQTEGGTISNISFEGEEVVE